MGIIAVLNLKMDGSSISSGMSGRNFLARSIRSRMSLEASSRLVPQLNFRVMREIPSRQRAVILSIPGVVASWFSSGSVTLDSMSSGLAPE